MMELAYCGLAMNEMHKIGKYSNQKYDKITGRKVFYLTIISILK